MESEEQSGKLSEESASLVVAFRRVHLTKLRVLASRLRVVSVSQGIQGLSRAMISNRFRSCRAGAGDTSPSSLLVEMVGFCTNVEMADLGDTRLEFFSQ